MKTYVVSLVRSVASPIAKLQAIGIVTVGAGFALTAWQTAQPHSDRTPPEPRVALCVQHQRVQVEPLLQPEVRKICECFVERIEKHMSETDKGIVYGLIEDNSRRNMNRLVEGMSPQAINDISRRLRTTMAGCAPLMTRKVPS